LTGYRGAATRPSTTSRSVRQTPQNETRTRSAEFPARGVGTSASSSSERLLEYFPGWRRIMARMFTDKLRDLVHLLPGFFATRELASAQCGLYPGPRRARPGNAVVTCPPSTTATPFTKT